MLFYKQYSIDEANNMKVYYLTQISDD